MNKIYKYRCPWCGEVVFPPSERFYTVNKCDVCEHYFSYYWSARLIIWEMAAILCLCISIWICVNAFIKYQAFPIIYVIISLGLFPDLYFKKMLKKVGESNPIDDINSWRVRFEIDSSSRFVFANNAIFPIEFISTNENIISEKFYVCISQVCKTKNEINCIVSELDFSRIQGKYKYDCFKIYIHDNKYFKGEFICEST